MANTSATGEPLTDTGLVAADEQPASTPAHSDERIGPAATVEQPTGTPTYSDPYCASYNQSQVQQYLLALQQQQALLEARDLHQYQYQDLNYVRALEEHNASLHRKREYLEQLIAAQQAAQACGPSVLTGDNTSTTSECQSQPLPEGTEAPPSDSATLLCANPGCTVTGNLKRCTRCGSVAYCGKECQAGHWKAHRKDCNANASA